MFLGGIFALWGCSLASSRILAFDAEPRWGYLYIRRSLIPAKEAIRSVTCGARYQA